MNAALLLRTLPNVLAVTTLHHVPLEHLDPRALEISVPSYAVLTTVRAVRPSS